ncbi:MAG: hypothetical protein AAFQ71_15655 [Planctomycetota bacterium]
MKTLPERLREPVRRKFNEGMCYDQSQVDAEREEAANRIDELEAIVSSWTELWRQVAAAARVARLEAEANTAASGES